MPIKPIGVLIAFENNTKFVGGDNKVYSLNKGDVLYFTGDALHAGAEYKNSNTRVHVYLDVKDVKRLKDTTWFPYAVTEETKND